MQKVASTIVHRILVFLACLALLTLRSWDRLTHPELWADDIALFGNVFNLGFKSLFSPEFGYFNFLQKLAFLSFIHLLPIDWIAGAENIFYLLIAACVFSTFSNRTYRWLVSSDLARTLCCLCFCLAAGLTEMFGNFPNLNWILFCYLVLIILKDPGEGIRNVDLAFSIVCLFSCGTSIVLFPLYLWRALKKMERNLLFLLLAFFLAQIALFSVRPTGKINFFFIGNLWLTPFFRHLFLQIVVQPFWGDGIATSLWRIPWLDYTLRAIVFFGLASWIYSNRKKPQIQAITIAVLATACTMILCWMARPGLPQYYGVSPEYEFWGRHYAFPLSFLGILFWFGLIGQNSVATQKWFGLSFLVLTLLHCTPRFFFPRYGDTPKWIFAAKKIKEAKLSGVETEVLIHLYPEDAWNVTLKINGSSTPR